MTTKQALEIIGGLSSPSKLPCYSYSIPAQKCITGNKLRDVKGSVCSKCYALKGMYGFPVVKNALVKRFESLSNPQWVEAMTTAIKGKEKSGYFRFHDSGDIQSVNHLKQIIHIVNNLPHIQFWLPTREYGVISDYINDGNVIPNNLTIRLSSYMLEGMPPSAVARKLGVLTSGVSKDSFNCPAPSTENKCGNCRACWNKNVPNVNYKQH